MRLRPRIVVPLVAIVVGAGAVVTTQVARSSGPQLAFVRHSTNSQGRGNFDNECQNSEASCDIWSIATDGSSGTKLTSTGKNDFPQVSPDGSRVAFTGTRVGEEGPLFVRNILGTGSPLKLADAVVAPSVTWAPGGGRIAYSHNGNIFVVAANGFSAPERLTYDSPDVCTSSSSCSEPTVGFDNSFPQWNHEGNKLAYMKMPRAAKTRGQIWVVNANGFNSPGVNISSGPANNLQPTDNFDNALTLNGLLVGGPSTVWSDDDDQVVFFSDTNGYKPPGCPNTSTRPLDNGSGSRIYLAPSTGGGIPVDITPKTSNGCNVVQEFGFPVWSPDGEQIAIRGSESTCCGSNSQPPGDIGDLWLIHNVDDPNPTSQFVTKAGSIWMRWSPNSQWLAFRGSKSVVNGQTVVDANSDVWVVSATGGSLHKITKTGSGNFSFSPDSSLLAIEGEPGGNGTTRHILLYKTSGAFVSRLTNAAVDDARPAFPPGPSTDD